MKFSLPKVYRCIVSVVVAGFAVLTGQHAFGQVVYTETFPNLGATQGSGDITLGSIGWSGYGGGVAIDLTNTTTHFRVRNMSGPNTSTYGVMQNNAGGIGLSFASNLSPINRSLTEISSFDFMLYSSVITDTVYMAIQIDVGGTPTWYVSNSGINSTIATTWQAQSFSFTTAASDWRLLTLEPGVTMSVAGTTLGSPLPSGDLLAAGFYTTNGAVTSGGPNGNLRFDDYSITVTPVPEPGSGALILMGCFAAVCARVCGSKSREHLLNR